MVDYWTNFAKYGNPNGKKAGAWTPYSAKAPKLMEFNVSGDKATFNMTDNPKYLGSSFKWR